MGTTNQYRRLIALIIAIVILIALPIYIEIYYITLYFIGLITLIPIAIFRIIKDEEFEKRFIKRWNKSREKGFWMNVFREGTRLFCTVIVVVCISQLFLNGRTPLGIASVLPNNALIGILLFLIILSFFTGIALWFENEKRYVQMKSKKEC